CAGAEGGLGREPRRAPYRSPAAWVLRQLDDRFSLLRPDSVVLDLGCFPGGWSEVAIERSEASSSSSRVIGVDATRMDGLEYHTFLQGDVAHEETLRQILKTLGDRRADLVLSDLAPALVGLKSEDHLNSMQCCLQAARIMERTLKLGGLFVLKFQSGPEMTHLRAYLDSRFDTVRSIRPGAIRCRGQKRLGRFYGVTMAVRRPDGHESSGWPGLQVAESCTFSVSPKSRPL
ncbi:unnamed protein product, partial [Durusdinium trenchii]